MMKIQSTQSTQSTQSSHKRSRVVLKEETKEFPDQMTFQDKITKLQFKIVDMVLG